MTMRNALICMYKYVFTFAVIFEMAIFLLEIAAQEEKTSCVCDKRRRRCAFAGSLLLCVMLNPCSMSVAGETPVWRDMLRLGGLSGFVGCLLAACIMDVETKLVYRYVWIAAFVPLLILFWTADKSPSQAGWTELMIFTLLQQVLFSHVYGRADSHAFCVCAMAFTIFGGGFAECVVHMAISFLLLCIIQVYRKNVTVKGKLKVPVAMVPYITVGFCAYMTRIK